MTYRFYLKFFLFEFKHPINYKIRLFVGCDGVTLRRLDRKLFLEDAKVTSEPDPVVVLLVREHITGSFWYSEVVEVQLTGENSVCDWLLQTSVHFFIT